MSIHTLQTDSAKLRALLDALGITSKDFEQELTKFEIDPRAWIDSRLRAAGRRHIDRVRERKAAIHAREGDQLCVCGARRDDHLDSRGTSYCPAKILSGPSHVCGDPADMCPNCFRAGEEPCAE